MFVAHQTLLLLKYIKDLFLLKRTDIFLNFSDYKSLDNVLNSVFDNYYKDWNYKYIIDRGPAGTEDNLKLVKKYFKQHKDYIFSKTYIRNFSFLDRLGKQNT